MKATQVSNDKTTAWDAGYAAGRDAGGRKGIPANPYAGTDAAAAFFEGYEVGFDDAYQGAKTGRALENPYRAR